MALMAGAAPCGPCHQAVVTSYQQTAHFLTSSSADSTTIRGSFLEGRNALQTAVPGVYFRMERRGEAFYQTAFDHGRSHSERFDLVLGSGRRGQSYLYWKGGLLYQLPVSYLALTGGWMNSPGYPAGEVHFERVIPPQCLECHATEGARAGQFLAGIACQKCHGPAEQHPAIPNPARLDREGKMALCAACHSGAGNGAEADVHGNQVGLLRQSQCYRNSPGMSCSTCHNIHRVERDLLAMSARCSACHAAPRHKRTVQADKNCIDCHMPQQESKAITFRTSGSQLAQQYRTHKIAIYPSQAAAAGEREAAQLRAAAEHLQQGQTEQAIRECKGVLAADPRSAPAHMLLGQAYLAQHSVGMVAEAKAELQQALNLDPDLLWARFYLAKIYLDLGRYDKAKEELERGLKQRPDVPHFLSLLGEANRKLGQPEESIELNRKALAVDPGMTPAHYYIALAYLDLKQDDEAIHELESCLQSKYVAPEMYLTLSSLYAKKQRPAEAEELCRKAIALDAARPEAYLSLAQLYNARAASDQALAALRLALPEGKSLPATAYSQQLQADVFYEQGRAYQAKGMKAQAIEAYSRSLQLDPNRAEARRRIEMLP